MIKNYFILSIRAQVVEVSIFRHSMVASLPKLAMTPPCLLIPRQFTLLRLYYEGNLCPFGSVCLWLFFPILVMFVILGSGGAQMSTPKLVMNEGGIVVEVC